MNLQICEFMSEPPKLGYSNMVMDFQGWLKIEQFMAAEQTERPSFLGGMNLLEIK